MLPPEIEVILFDAGGTLVTLDYDFIARTARQHGCEVAAAAVERGEAQARLAVDETARVAGGHLDQDEDRRAAYLARMLVASGAAAEAATAVARELDRSHLDENLWRVPRHDALHTLRGLRERGLRTGVISNADGRAEAMMQRVGLAEHLDLVVDSHLEGVEKPDPEIFHRTLARLDVAPGRAAYVGDIYSIDAVGARAAGLVPVIIDTTGSYAALDCPVIERLGELLEALERLAGGEGAT